MLAQSLLEYIEEDSMVASDDARNCLLEHLRNELRRLWLPCLDSVTIVKSWIPRVKALVSDDSRFVVKLANAEANKRQQWLAEMFASLDSEAATIPLDNLSSTLYPIVARLNEIRNLQSQDISQHLDEIAVKTFNVFIDHLKRQAEIDSLTSADDCEDGPRKVPTVELEVWQGAWKEPYIGDAVSLLEAKLEMYVDQLGENSLSPIIPIVQSSTTGKSRLAEEFVARNFAVSVSLQSGGSFPRKDDYVSEYFHDPTANGFYTRIINENTYGIDGLSSVIVNPDVSPRPTYMPKHRNKHPSGESKPCPWAALARLRVAYFVAGFFETLCNLLENDVCKHINYWQTQFQHIPEKDENRKQLWRIVVTKALQMIKKDKLQEEWLHSLRSVPVDLTEGISPPPTKADTAAAPQPKVLTNDEIKVKLREILRDPLKCFFDGGYIRKLQEGRKILPFVFIVDEAAYLHHVHYLKAFTWVFDVIICDLLWTSTSPDWKYFFVLMLGTHSQISHFAPDEHFPSERIFNQEQLLPTVFTSLALDASNIVDRPQVFSSMNHIDQLVLFGRAAWKALLNSLSSQPDMSKRAARLTCIRFAMSKIRKLNTEERHELSYLATLAIRLSLDMDLAHPTNASHMVSSKLRWLLDVDSARKRISTTYPSEPILAEAAACLMNGFYFVGSMINDSTYKPIDYYIQVLELHLNRGFVDRGSNGELTAKLLFMFAKDTFHREEAAKVPHNEWKAVNSFYNLTNSDGDESALLFNGTVPLNKLFIHLFSDKVLESLRENITNTPEKHAKKWNNLENAYVNFSHWTLVDESADEDIFTKRGIWYLWKRHAAVICQKNFPHIDLVIPIAYAKSLDEEICEDNMSYILISVRNRTSGTEDKLNDYLDSALIDGDKLMQSGNPEAIPQIDPPRVRLTPKERKNKINYLGLRYLPFYAKGHVSTQEKEAGNEWIQSTADQPMIAIIMSFGSTDEANKVFLGEKAMPENDHRIVFAVRGLTNSYKFPTPQVKDWIKNIAQRFDISGDFPQTAATCPTEQIIFEASRRAKGGIQDYYFENFGPSN